MFHWHYVADAIRTLGPKSGVFVGQGVGKSLELSLLDTARLPTQTKFSIFENNSRIQMAGVKGKKALDLLKQKRILISCKKSN